MKRITITTIYDLITNIYFTGMTNGVMIPLSKAKEPEIFRGFWPLFYISKYLKEEIYIWNTRFLIVYQVYMVR